MSFIRRHWPDLIISLLIVALLIGFGMVLLGGNKKSVANTGPDSPTPTPPAAQQGAQQGSQPTPPNNTDTTTQAAPTEPTPAPAQPSPAPTPAAGIPQAPGDQNAAGDLPTIAGQQESGSSTQAQTPPVSGTSEAASGASTPANSTAALSTPAAGNPVATSRDGTPTRREYRVSVGTYTSEALARARTASLTARGYTVHLIPVAAGYVAQIGPFADEQTGRRALADIRQTTPAAVLRAPIGGTAVQGDSTQSSTIQNGAGTDNRPAPTPSANQDSTDQGSATSAPAPTPAPADNAATPEAPSSTPLYLQVGAFDQQDRAQSLVQQLRDLGYEPSIIAPPGRKVRVLVGPYTGDALTRTEGRLSQSGIEHFRVR